MLTLDYIRNRVADSEMIYKRGEKLFETGAYCCLFSDLEKGKFEYGVDGNYGDYQIRIDIAKDKIHTQCDCPYPGVGCKHTVAALLDITRQIGFVNDSRAPAPANLIADDFLTHDEIRGEALEDRKKRAKTEKFTVTPGDMFKGEHLVETLAGRQYTVTFHDPERGIGHCTCPDFATNKLNTCKHMIFLQRQLKETPGYKKQIQKEIFPFVDVFWDSIIQKPRVFCEMPHTESPEVQATISQYFDSRGIFKGDDLSGFMPLLSLRDAHKRLKIGGEVLKKLDECWAKSQMAELSAQGPPDLSIIKATLYPYQKQGIAFCAHKTAALIGDEMGLGKTLQAIAASILKKRIFGFDKVLVVTLASLKEQWKREIERFTDEKAIIIAGPSVKRQLMYQSSDSLFKITNYEALLRDVGVISRFKPDVMILDEAQRIKNFNTKTADAAKRIPRKHALVLTGTPLENKLEDVYSVVQFLDPDLLSPLWEFAANHFMLSRSKKGKILGYRNLDALHQNLKPLVIRRKKKDVLEDLPDEIVNNYYIDLTDEQIKIHSGYAQSLMPLMNKKFLTPVDLRRIQELLLKMRQVCDSTYLIDRKTNISPKLKELASILDEVVIQSGRKVVIFSEWITMTFLIAKHLSNAGISFVELSGKIPVDKRQPLIDEFFRNPDCKVFLSTDAGGTGLNLQAADCVINVELPWSPARMNQRIGRVNRIGQKSRCVNVINLIARRSIEEKIYAGIQLKTDLFKGVFDGGIDSVEFSSEKKTELLNRLREMMQEEPEIPKPEYSPSEEIPADTPHFLNPEVLGEKKDEIAYDVEEPEEVLMTESADADAGSRAAVESGPERPASDGRETAPGALGTSGGMEEGSASFSGQSPEKIETVLNSGMAFLAGLFEMATGKKMQPAPGENRMIAIDRQTGEVTMKFKLPGF
ncbi:MAG: DEAD/DEAH box helicase [Desulfosalsimonadaceae bacterium]